MLPGQPGSTTPIKKFVLSERIMSKVVPGEMVPGEVVPGEVVDVESPPAAVVDAQFESDDGREEEEAPRRWEIPPVGDLLVYFVFCPCAVGYFLWVSAPACWAALYEHVLAPVGGFVHDHLLVPLGKCLGACWGLLARACTALYKHVLVPIGTAVAAGAAATYNHVLVPIGTALAAVAAAVRSVMPF